MSRFRNWLPGALGLCLLTITLLAGGDAMASAPAAEGPALLAHQAALELDAAGTSWLGTSTALVLLMTLPGLALFYGGMVRRKNVIATITQSVGVFAVVSLVWFVAGYSLAFSNGGDLNSYIGGFDALFLNGVTMETAHACCRASRSSCSSRSR